MDNGEIGQKNKTNKKWILNIPLFVGFILIFAYYFLSAPVNNKDVYIHITSGQSITSVSQILKDKNAIRNNFALKVFIKLLKSGKGIVIGDYLIKKDSPVWNVAWQISRGYHNVEPIKLTIREGLTNEEIADLLADKLSGFRKDLFLASTYDKQGYLFPDTYFFYPLDTTDEIVEKLSSNFDRKIAKISSQIKTSGKSRSEIIIMASILEGEANGEKDADVISGILWKRIERGMRLQVDVDRTTYMTSGLPSKPLNNPGLVSIEAALNPIESSYLYYLHDKDGNVHYAKSFEEHKRNIANYLK